MSQDISSLPLIPDVRYKLRSSGYTSFADFSEVTPLELSKEASLTKEEALEVLKQIYPEKYNSRPRHSPVAVSAFDLYSSEQQLGSIVSFCEKLDDALGGGFPISKLTEICGAPGVGKTQMCLQLSVGVQILKNVGGVGGECIYIDTEGSFTLRRLCEMADAAVQCCAKISNNGNIEGTTSENLTVDKILSGVYIYRCMDHIELISIVNLLEDTLKERPNVKLIIIDSIAFPFRNNFKDMSLRSRLLNNLSQTLFEVASTFKLAVILTNQMTSRLDDNQTMTLIPALGESWGHVCTNRILLSWKDDCRYAHLFKSPIHPEVIVPFNITTAGIRDHFPENTTEKENSQTKRTKT